MSENKQHIAVFQQNGSGEKKIKGIEEYGEDKFILQKYSIEEQLPEIIDDSEIYLPRDLHCDLVLDFLAHPDLSSDLAEMCSRKKIPVVASGKKTRMQGVHTPFT